MLSLGHKNLDVWKKSIELVKIIYKSTENFPQKEIYGLTNQIRRASVSVPSNIAEGSARKSGLERKRFFEIARGSLVEIDTQLIIAKELNYIKEEELSIIEKYVIDVFSMLSNLINNTK
jgi:four helix bundle protein